MIWNLTSFRKYKQEAESRADEPQERVCANPDTLSPLDLAFVGDTVFDLLVREELVSYGSRPVGALHKMAVERVRAGAQAKYAFMLMPVLTEEETAIYKRGRNAHVGGIPKHATNGEYHAATGLEALFGWLYLKGRIERIIELYDFICKKESAENEDKEADLKADSAAVEG